MASQIHLRLSRLRPLRASVTLARVFAGRLRESVGLMRVADRPWYRCLGLRVDELMQGG